MPTVFHRGPKGRKSAPLWALDSFVGAIPAGRCWRSWRRAPGRRQGTRRVCLDDRHRVDALPWWWRTCCSRRTSAANGAGRVRSGRGRTGSWRTRWRGRRRRMRRCL